MASKKEWNEYFKLERHTWSWIVENTEEILQTDPPSNFYKYIRCIRLLKDLSLLKQMKLKIKKLDSLYKKLSNTNISHRNLPVILNDVEQINLSINEAYTSISITEKTPNETFVLKKYVNVNFSEEYEKYKETCKLLKKVNLTFHTKETKSGIEILVKYKNLLSFAGTKHIQARKHTGLDYRLRIRKKNETKSARKRYNFIILTNEAIIVRSNPQAQRPHRLEKIKEKVELPIKTRYTFYIMD